MKKLLFILLLIPSVAFSDPSVTGVSGTFTHGSSVTIFGSGFGTQTTAAPNLWDTVDNQYSLSNGTAIPSGLGHPWNEEQGSTYDTSDAQRHSYGTAMYKSTDGHVDNHVVSPAGNLYVSWWLKMDTNPVPPAGNHSSKFIRASNSAHEDDPNVDTFSWTQQEAYVYNGSYLAEDWLDNGQTDWATTPNQWNFLEVWFDNTAKTYSIRVNGSYKVNASSWSGGSFNFDEVWLIGFDAGGTAPPTLNLWTDDIYIDNTFARIMIGDASTYAGCTHFELQPATSWSATSATITLNQGSFASSSTAYVYVIDSTGAANSTGQSIAFGSSGAVNGTCGSASGQSFISLTSGSANLCSTGTVASFMGTGPWTWGCNGSGGGSSTASNACSASLLVAQGVPMSGVAINGGAIH